jgi:hypothetical protein
MRTTNTRLIAVAGIIVSAVVAVFLLTPSVHQLGSTETTWVGAAILILPVAALLTATGTPHYGFVRSLVVGLVVGVLTGVITWIVAVVVLAAALAGSAAGTLLGIALYACPAVCVLVLGLLALRVVAARPTTPEPQPEPAGTSGE